MTSNIHFGLKIRELIDSKRMTQTAASKLIGYTLPGFTKLLGKEDIGTDVLKKICAAFNIDMSYFLTNNGTYVSQKGTGNVNASGVNNSVSAYNTDATNIELIGLRSENESLKEQIVLLKKIISMYEKGH